MRFLKMFLFISVISSIAILAAVMGGLALTSFMNDNILSGIGCTFLFLLCISLLTVIADGYVYRGWFD